MYYSRKKGFIVRPNAVSLIKNAVGRIAEMDDVS